MTEGWAFDPETERFRRMEDLPSFQNGLAATQLGGRLYAMGGANNFGLSVPTNRSIDPGTGAWTEHRPMQSARRDAAIAVLNGEIWLMGGDNNGPLQSVEIYTPETDRWRNGPLLPAGRKGARAIVRDGAIYLIGGEGEGGALQRILRLPNPEGQWANYGAALPIAYASVVPVHDNSVAVIGGRDADGVTNRVQRWNWRNGQVQREWIEVTQLGEAYDRAAAAALNGRIYVFGGNANEDPGPEGVATIQTFDTQCLNGVVDPGEGLGDGVPDAGGACGNVTGCQFLNDPTAAALAACRADGYTCQRFGNGGVRGWRAPAGAGSNCSPGQWRFYCTEAGGRNDIDACTTCPSAGAVVDALRSCNCNVPGQVLRFWCEP